MLLIVPAEDVKTIRTILEKYSRKKNKCLKNLKNLLFKNITIVREAKPLSRFHPLDQLIYTRTLYTIQYIRAS